MNAKEFLTNVFENADVYEKIKEKSRYGSTIEKWSLVNRNGMYYSGKAKKTKENEIKIRVAEILKDANNYLDKLYLMHEWFSGGVGGGSCWDDGETNNHYHIEGEVKPEFTVFDLVLEKVCPNISFLKYKCLMPLMETDTREEHEYYGNASSYTQEFVNLKKLFDKLNEIGIINNV